MTLPLFQTSLSVLIKIMKASHFHALQAIPLGNFSEMTFHFFASSTLIISTFFLPF